MGRAGTSDPVVDGLRASEAITGAFRRGRQDLYRASHMAASALQRNCHERLVRHP